MDAVYTGNLNAATKMLENDKKLEKPERNKLLFYLNKGTVLHLAGNYIQSNIYFRKADYYVEDFNKNFGREALALITNPKVTDYGGESFEQILIHYYGALNYLMLDDLDAAIIEAKRMLSKLQRITDSYKSNNKYKFDAFAHNLAGIIYDASGDMNNAFIAYRNAYKIYNDDYSVKFNTQVPEQLKHDLLRTAFLSGFTDDVLFFEKEFKIKFDKNAANYGSDAVFFWNNGFGPVKDEWSINFTIIPYANHPGWVEIANWDLGFSFPYKVDNDNDRKDLLDMKIIRMALPKYITRNTVYNKARLISDSTTVSFYLAQPVNAIAYKSLEDRQLAELSKGILRVALKQLIAYRAKKEKQSGLALAAQLYGAISEQADTRNWQLLPHGIFYTRIKLKVGSQVLTFNATGNNQATATQTFKLNIKKSKTAFAIANTMVFNGYSNQVK